MNFGKNVFPMLMLAVMAASCQCHQTLKKDEDVIVFPSYAYQGTDGNIQVNFHAWIFEPSWLPADAANLIRRVLPFTADNERQKTLQLKLGKQTLKPGLSSSNGHLEIDMKVMLAADERTELEAGRLVLSWDRGGEQKPIWIDSEGLSVVSDIDDTIKVSQVLDRSALLANSFVHDFQPVPDMPGIYQTLAATGARFHYISASPWQLYPDLQAFLEKHYPLGTVSLRLLRLKDSSGPDFLSGDSAAYKIDTIAALMQKFPKRKFLLIGDSGEKDPEVYATLKARFPHQILAILIRIPPEQKETHEKEGMTYFREAAELRSVIQKLNDSGI